MLPNRSYLPAAVAGVLLPSVPRRGVPVARNEAHGEYSKLLLWEKDVILLFGKAYGRKQIRRSMIFRMMPEHLDEAVNFFVHSQELTTAEHLAELIFACVIHGDTLTDIQFERDFGGAA